MGCRCFSTFDARGRKENEIFFKPKYSKITASLQKRTEREKPEAQCHPTPKERRKFFNNVLLKKKKRAKTFERKHEAERHTHTHTKRKTLVAIVLGQDKWGGISEKLNPPKDLLDELSTGRAPNTPSLFSPALRLSYMNRSRTYQPTRNLMISTSDSTRERASALSVFRR